MGVAGFSRHEATAVNPDARCSVLALNDAHGRTLRVSTDDAVADLVTAAHVCEDRLRESVRCRRVEPLIAITVGGLVALIGVAVSVFVLTQDDTIPADGNQIAYSCKEQHNTWYAICISNTDGTSRQRITKQIHTSTPSWSPDGRQIAFTRNEDVGEYTPYSADDVFVIDADGGNVRQLHATVTADRPGNRLGLPTDVRLPTSMVSPFRAARCHRNGALFVMDADGDNVRRLTRGNVDTDPAWSPKEKRLRSRAASAPTQTQLTWICTSSMSQVARPGG